MNASEAEVVYRELKAKAHSQSRLEAHGFKMKSDSNVSTKNVRQIATFQQTPEVESPFAMPSRVVALDCEMVQVAGGAHELAFLAAIDFFTGKVLINNYVKPLHPVVNWLTPWSGLTEQGMDWAIANGLAIYGWHAAREVLWQVIDDKTILVGHSLQNDLNVLGIIHRRVVDSALITAEAVWPEHPPSKRFPRIWSLKNLTRWLLGYDIQNGWGHSALEDACASRNVVRWCLRHPDGLRAWAEWSLAEEERKAQAIRERRKQQKANDKARKEAKMKAAKAKAAPGGGKAQ
ncbi:hypothetical protein N7470_005268 [Penicillium chermesinum]|nr:hypothetical protein N7470_005268 [Penicillium chermesinum]